MNLAKTVFLLFICTTSLLFVKSEPDLLPEEHPKQQSDEFINFAIPNTETFLTKKDFENAKKHPIKDEGDIDDSAMYNKDLFEGDIANPELNMKGNDAAISAAETILENAIVNGKALWANGRIPYTISAQFSAVSKKVIASAFAEIQAKTCLRLVPKQAAHKNYVAIQPLRGCYSYIGNINRGGQALSLGTGCVHKGIVIHEIMHAAGFYHEQSRNDRDNYVTIHFANIATGYAGNFKKGGALITHLGTAYDYGSLMHYGPKAFSKNGKNTITPKKAGVTIGQRNGLSNNDALKINKLYKCKPAPPTCRDTISYCSYYQRFGFCMRPDAAGNWFRNVCKKTCRLCGRPPVCRNLYPIVTCNKYARWCSTNWFVRRVCEQRCNLCRCRDTLPVATCNYYSRWCSASVWVRRVCPKKCNQLCGCKDIYRNDLCNYYARYCKTSAGVRRICRKTCNQCSCRNLYPTNTCNYYFRYCTTNAAVRRVCQLKCGLC